MPETQSTDPKLINWATRQAKRAQDPALGALMAPYLLEELDRTDVSMLTLPAADWAYEQYLLNTHPDLTWAFAGIEKDPAIAMSMEAKGRRLVNANGTSAVHHSKNMTTTEYLKKHDTRFDIVYFDYMGTWSQKKEADLRLLCRRPPGLYACTIALNRGSRSTNSTLEECSAAGRRHLEWIQDKTGRYQAEPHYKITGTPARIISVFNEEGVFATMVGGFVYDSPSNSAIAHIAEMTMVFRIGGGSQ